MVSGQSVLVRCRRHDETETDIARPYLKKLKQHPEENALMPPLARAALTSLALPAALNARPRSEECTHTSVVVDFIEVSDACEIGHLGGPGFASPLHGRLEAGPNVQPIAVARPAPHGTNDRGRCALGEERR